MDKRGPRLGYFEKLIPALKEIHKTNELISVIGGGPFVRSWLAKLKESKLSSEQQEWIAIELLRGCVRTLEFMLGNAKPVWNLADLDEKQLKKLVPVIGGIKPGRSTDANAALAAEKVKADWLYILTDVDGIYMKDPNKYKLQEPLDKISFKDAKKIAVKPKPGYYGVIDPLALEVIARSKIKTRVFNGKNPRLLLDVLEGRRLGTEIR